MSGSRQRKTPTQSRDIEVDRRRELLRFPGAVARRMRMTDRPGAVEVGRDWLVPLTLSDIQRTRDRVLGLSGADAESSRDLSDTVARLDAAASLFDEEP